MQTRSSRACRSIGMGVLMTGALIAPQVQEVQAQDAATQAATGQDATPANPTIGDAPVASVEAVPTLITLQMKDAAPQAIVDAFVAQAKIAGVELKAPTNLEGGPVSIDLDHQPFWAALRMLCLRLDLSLSQTYSGHASPLVLLDNSKLKQDKREGQQNVLLRGPVSGNEQFLIVATGAARSDNRFVKFGTKTQPESRQSLTLQLSAFPDPSFRMTGSSSSVRLDEATDETGASVVASQPSEHNYFYAPFGYSDMNSLSLLAPMSPAAGRRITRLKGTLNLRVVAKMQVWTVPDVLNARDAVLTITKPDSIERYILEGVERPEPNKVLVRLRIERNRTADAPPEAANAVARVNRLREEQSMSINNALRAAKLVDAEGRELANSGSTQSSFINRDEQQTSAQITFSRTPNGPETLTGEAAKLVWEIPVEYREIEVPFTFSDLPLP